MELRTVMRTTPASRAFTGEELPDDVLYDILDHARFAPNGSNRQAWHVTVVRDPARKARLAELWGLAMREPAAFSAAGMLAFVASEAYWRNPPGQPSMPAIELSGLDIDEAERRPPGPGAPALPIAGTPVAGAKPIAGASPSFVAGASAILVLSVDLREVSAMDSGLGRLSISAGASVYPFAHNVLLAARDSGFGGVITTVLVRQEPAVKELLHLPDDHAIACTIPLGRPAKEVRRLRRQPVEAFATSERFDGPAFGAPAPLGQ